MKNWLILTCGLLMVGLPMALLANDYNVIDCSRYDLLTAPAVVVVQVTPAPPAPTELTAEVTSKWFPAPASDAQMVKLQSVALGGASTVVTRSRTVTRASVGSYGYASARARLVRRVFGMFRGRVAQVGMGCASGACSY